MGKLPLVWLLALAFGATVLGACDEGEKDVAGDDGDELSAQEILAEVVKVAGDLHSFHVETVTEPQDAGGTSLGTSIHVGPDYYTQLEHPGLDLEPFEFLFYRGTVYQRQGGEWVEPTDGTQWLGYYSDSEDSNEGDAERSERIQAVLGFDPEHLVGASLGPEMGDGLLRLHVTWRVLTGATAPPPEGEHPDDPPTLGDGSIEFWVDDDYHVLRRVWVIDSYSGDRLLSSQHMESTFSMFNEAELPGPLPD